MNTIQVVGLVAGICTALSLLPQLIKMLKEKKARDLSLFYLTMLFVGLCLWIVYGFLRSDIPIIVTNATSLALNVVIIALGIRYKSREAANQNQ